MRRFVALTILFALMGSAALAKSIDTTNGNGLVFGTGVSSPTTERMRITQFGNVGISNTNPIAKLDVVGTISASDAIQVSGSSLTCSAGLKGAMRYSNTSSTIEYCQGSAWTSLGPSDTAVIDSLQTTSSSGLGTTSACPTYVDVPGSSKSVTFATPGVTAMSWSSGWYSTAASTAVLMRPCIGATCGTGLGFFANEGLSHKQASGSWSTNVPAGTQTVKLQICRTAGSGTVSQDSGDSISWVTWRPGSGGSGGGATPAGSSNDVQYNSSGALAADTGNFTYASGVLTAPTMGTGGLTVTGQVSATNVSGTLIQLGRSTATCNSGLAGGVRYNVASATVDVCNGTSWTAMPSGTLILGQQTIGTISATFGTNCPIPPASGNATTNVSNACNGQTTCNFTMSVANATGSDPCSGTSKQWAISYKCGVATKSTTGSENGTAALTCSGYTVSATANAAGSSGDIQFNSGGSLAADTGQLFWDETNNRLGVGTNSPAKALDVVGQISATSAINASWQGTITASNTAVASTAGLLAGQVNGAYWAGVAGTSAIANGVGVYGSGGHATALGGYFTNTAGGPALAIGTGNMGIGTNLPIARLDVRGTISASDAIQVSGSSLTCSAGLKGAMRYSNTSSTIEYCQGTAWTSMGPSATDVPSFLVNRNGTNQTVTSNVDTTIDWTAEVFDTNNNFDLATDRFTPTVAGKYLVRVSANCTSGSGYCITRVQKNGLAVASNGDNSGGSDRIGKRPVKAA